MTEEDFEIDIYGDSSGEQGGDGGEDDLQHGYRDRDDDHGANGHDDYDDHHRGDVDTGHRDDHQSHSGDHSPATLPESTPHHGVKRKESSDERPIDPSATSAIMISELSWWSTDDDIRGWVSQAGCEDELKEITFSEHKVNGKSKG